MNYVNSKVMINQSVIDDLKKAAIIALEKTGDYVLGEVVEAQVIPFDTGFLQSESTYVDKKNSASGNVKIVSSTPYARRLYFHPEYDFNQNGWDEIVYGKRGRFAKNGREYKGKKVHHPGNANAKGLWLEDWTEDGKYAKDVKKAYELFFKELGGL